MQPAINGGRAPTLYHPLWLHQGVVDARGAVSVIFRGCTGCTWVPHQLSVGGADKTVQTLSRLQSSSASHCVSPYLVQSASLLQTMPIHPSRSSMMSSQARLPICETARQTRRQPSTRSTPVKLEESAFCILEAWRRVRGCCKW